ncbi:amidohydrolase [bacterium]|nr:amidohydrolase [bacterium]
MHVHVFPDDIAEKTVGFLAKEANAEAFLNGTVYDLRRSMDIAGISFSINQPIATKPSQVRSINNWARQIEDDRIISFGTIHPHFEDFDEEIRRIKGMGIKGIKLHPDYQKFYPDDESVFPIYECLVENDMFVLFHAGVDIGLYPPVHATPQRLARVLDSFPKIKMIAAHLGGYDCWDDVERCLVGRDVFFDTSYVIDYMEKDRFVRIMSMHGFDRILFATDSPWKPQADELEKISSLPIPEKAKEDILYRNACALLGI